jgi:hypothetical protein
MAESSIQVQPAATAPAGQPAPAPAALKMIVLPDGTLAQAMCFVDDQGRVQQLMTEATGQRIAALLLHIATTLANANGVFPPSDDTAGMAPYQG